MPANAVIIVVTGDGMPQMHYTGSLPNDAFDEAYDFLKRGVAGHFQMVPQEADPMAEAYEALTGKALR